MSDERADTNAYWQARKGAKRSLRAWVRDLNGEKRRRSRVPRLPGEGREVRNAGDMSRTPELLQHHREYFRDFVLPKGKAYRKMLRAACKAYDAAIATERATRKRPRRLPPITVEPSLEKQAKRQRVA